MPAATQSPGDSGDKPGPVVKRKTKDMLTLTHVSQAKLEKAKTLIKEGVPLNTIAKELGMSYHTLNKITEVYASELPSYQERSVKMLQRIVDQAGSLVIETMDQQRPGQLPITLAVAWDKLQAAQGLPTTITQVNVAKADHGKIIDIMSSLPDQNTPKIPNLLPDKSEPIGPEDITPSTP